ncbi:protein PSK SIMULATOR 2-like [Vigna umbellata]|uniref:protein PSK SIMULATOR 2-like n=1 Tax=Vigna umbellata TaxID=87088 RepID=UPI001F5EE85C|nr:protein PSK SIMULATOR 2-like [Vigna umbellata]XP_047168141.1 protein PSK SIMULATOR 2-like [Vigna umbellata]XP_047168142.1 protein PSK SIMULATOR 2-like [Vigna umbellata]
MGSVCSAGKAEKNKNKEVRGKGLGNLKKLKSVAKGKGDCFSNSKISDRGRKKNGSEFRISNPTGKERKQGSQRGSIWGRAGERAVEVLDTLGSSVPKLSNSNGFGTAVVPRGNRISILAFEVANTINKGAILFQSLSEENIQFLKKEILQSEGLQQLVSTDTKELIGLVEADKREEFNAFSREVARFGNMCKDPQWHNLERYFSRLHMYLLDNMQPRVEAENTMQELTTLSHSTAELYHELTSLERFEQDYQNKIKEMESLNLPLNGDSLTAFQIEIKHQRKFVRSLKRKSLWSRRLEEIVEKLVDIVTHMDQAIFEFLGNHGTTSVNSCKGSERLGEAGLSLHYANIINQINMIASRPTVLPPNMRDTLYHGLPNNIKNALPSRLQNADAMKQLSITEFKAEMDKTLQWLTPFATNTTKVHQGFGWVGEWANSSTDFCENTSKENKLIRLQTLYYAEKQKIDFYIVELLTRLHYLVTFVRYRHSNPMRPMSTTTSPKRLEFQAKMLEFITLDISKSLGTQLSQEDKRLLEEVTMRRRNPGVSKSEDLASTKKRRAKVCHHSNSVGSSPFTTKALENQKSNLLDIMDGL